MRKEQWFAAGALFGIIITMLFMVSVSVPKEELIKHNCARYNPMTAEFEWIKKGE